MEYAFIWCVNGDDDGVHIVQPELTTADDDDDLPELPPLSELGELIAD